MHGSLAALPVLGLRAADRIPQAREAARVAMRRLDDGIDAAASSVIAPTVLFLAQQQRQGRWPAEQTTRARHGPWPSARSRSPRATRSCRRSRRERPRRCDSPRRIRPNRRRRSNHIPPRRSPHRSDGRSRRSRRRRRPRRAAARPARCGNARAGGGPRGGGFGDLIRHGAHSARALLCYRAHSRGAWSCGICRFDAGRWLPAGRSPHCRAQLGK